MILLMGLIGFRAKMESVFKGISDLMRSGCGREWVDLFKIVIYEYK